MTETANVHCAANGCPMSGCMSRSTSGSTEWYCFLHFGCKSGTGHAITNELQRLGWLVKLTQALRTNGGSAHWDRMEEAGNKEIRLNQSSHLLRGDHETLPAWLARLEDTLRIACAIPAQPDTQQPLEV